MRRDRPGTKDSITAVLQLEKNLVLHETTAAEELSALVAAHLHLKDAAEVRRIAIFYLGMDLDELVGARK